MRKRILLLCFVVICMVLLRPFYAGAATPLDPGAEAGLTLHYQKDGVAFPDLYIGIYRVAEAFPDGTFELIEPFSDYPVNIHGITSQEQWQNVATTLTAYIIANRVEPDRAEWTNGEGMVAFTGVRTGLYLVREAVADHTDGTYIFNQFMIYLPTPQADGTYEYQMEAKPKCVSFTPKNQYTVTKLWQDEGKEVLRPEEVTVEIYKDGALQETQILNAENNWSYTWYVSEEEDGQWTVVERDVPQEYLVTVREKDGIFSIINTCQGESVVPPTGDSVAPMPWILAMCLSGCLLMLLGIYNRRRG